MGRQRLLAARCVLRVYSRLYHHSVTLFVVACVLLGFGEDHPLRNSNMNIPVLVPVFMNVQVYAVACGADYSIAATRDGAVYTWGANSCGQLGHGDTDSRPQPCRVERLWQPDKFRAAVASAHAPPRRCTAEAIDVQIAAGREHTIVILCGGAFGVSAALDDCANTEPRSRSRCSSAHMQFGSNTVGQLGLSTIEQATSPVRIVLSEWIPFTPEAAAEVAAAAAEPILFELDDPTEQDTQGNMPLEPAMPVFTYCRTGGGFERIQLPASVARPDMTTSMGVTNDHRTTTSPLPTGSSITGSHRHNRRTSSAGKSPSRLAPMKLAGLYIKKLSTAARVACGAHHTVFIDKRGRVWSW